MLLEKSCDNFKRDRKLLKTSDKDFPRVMASNKCEEKRKKTRDKLDKTNKSVIEVRRKREEVFYSLS
jgi:hypothetical protein